MEYGKMATKRIVVPVPSYGFDPTEAAIPWKFLSEAGHEVQFSTPNGKVAAADTLVLSGKRFGVFKSTFSARKDAINVYHALVGNTSFSEPKKYQDIHAEDYDAILLPGGHDKGVKEYLESEILQRLIVSFFEVLKPVAAICHGVVLVARSIDPDSQKSVIYNYKSTSLLKLQELFAFNATRLWLKDYFLTYPGTTVEDEVKSALSDSANFVQGPLPLLRDSKSHPERGFALRDRNYLSARWYGDAYRFSIAFLEMLEEKG